MEPVNIPASAGKMVLRLCALCALLALLSVNIAACDTIDDSIEEDDDRKTHQKDDGKQDEGYRLLKIMTDSMAPTFGAKDIIVVDTAYGEHEDLQVGDVITYWMVIDGERMLNTHRIIEIYDAGGFLVFQTQGDNNLEPDSLTVHEAEIVGLYQYTLEGTASLSERIRYKFFED